MLYQRECSVRDNGITNMHSDICSCCCIVSASCSLTFDDRIEVDIITSHCCDDNISIFINIFNLWCHCMFTLHTSKYWPFRHLWWILMITVSMCTWFFFCIILGDMLDFTSYVIASRYSQILYNATIKKYTTHILCIWTWPTHHCMHDYCILYEPRLPYSCELDVWS